MQVIGYARVSTEEQAREGVSMSVHPIFVPEVPVITDTLGAKICNALQLRVTVPKVAGATGA